MTREEYEKALKYVVNGEQQPCDDAISRQAVLDILKDKWNMFSDANDAMQESIDTIESLQPVIPQQKMGRWIAIDEEPHEVWECDHCGFVIDGSGCIDPYDYRDTYKFCPNCGAKMQEVEE